MRATDRFCLASATYLSSCSCRTQHRIRRGEGVPRCPECGTSVDWEFVRSDYMPAIGSEARAETRDDAALRPRREV